MANFRNTNDYVTRVLELAGEPTASTGSYYSAALEHLNNAHRAIIAGGMEINPEVDEVWPWSRARHPIELELMPEVEGTVTVTKGSEAITFSAAPTDEDASNISLAGYYLKFKDKTAVYKIATHTSGSTSAELTTKVSEASASYTFRAYKLDYVVEPSHIVIESGVNDYIGFAETTAKTFKAATITAGAYTPTELATAIAGTLTSVGDSTYTCFYRSDRRVFSIFSDGSGGDNLFYLIGENALNAGTIRTRSALPTLGIGVRDLLATTTSGSTSVIESENIVNAVARLIQPFKLHTGYRETEIEGMDPIQFDREFPLSAPREMNPTYFSVREQTDQGRFTVRFNGYPSERKTIMIDYIPLPVDLYNSIGSKPLIPHSDHEALLFTAVANLLYEKEDSKADVYMQRAARKLESMSQNLKRTNKRINRSFAQTVAREDLVFETNYLRRRRYGYTKDNW